MKQLFLFFIMLTSAAVHATPWGAEPVTLFDNLAAEDIGLEIDVISSYSFGDSEGWTGVTASNGAWLVSGYFGLMVSQGYDTQARPWMRIKQFDYRQVTPITGGCNIDAPVLHSGDRIAVTDLGNDWCRCLLLSNGFTRRSSLR